MTRPQPSRLRGHLSGEHSTRDPSVAAAGAATVGAVVACASPSVVATAHSVTCMTRNATSTPRASMSRAARRRRTVAAWLRTAAPYGSARRIAKSHTRCEESLRATRRRVAASTARALYAARAAYAARTGSCPAACTPPAPWPRATPAGRARRGCWGMRSAPRRDRHSDPPPRLP